MLKKRVIAALLLIDDLVVQSIGFRKYLPVGKLDVAVEFLNNWGVDEIVVLDIKAAAENRTIDANRIRQAAKKCFVPVAVGGGIRTLSQVDSLIHSGADKVILNSVLQTNPTFLHEVAHTYGDQCAVVCIDVAGPIDGRYFAYDHLRKTTSSTDVVEWAKRLQDLGAGEIILHHTTRDGGYQGFDEVIINKVCDQVTIPVVALGGAGSPVHFESVFTNTRVSAAAAGNYFHFTEHAVTTLKGFLHARGISIRIETQANYLFTGIDGNNRLEKKDDSVLSELLFTKIQPEII